MDDKQPPPLFSDHITRWCTCFRMRAQAQPPKRKRKRERMRSARGCARPSPPCTLRAASSVRTVSGVCSPGAASASSTPLLLLLLLQLLVMAARASRCRSSSSSTSFSPVCSLERGSSGPSWRWYVQLAAVWHWYLPLCIYT